MTHLVTKQPQRNVALEKRPGVAHVQDSHSWGGCVPVEQWPDPAGEEVSHNLHECESTTELCRPRVSFSLPPSSPNRPSLLYASLAE